MQFDHYEYSIASHFLPALINNDLSGLESQDEADFKSWLENTPDTIEFWDCGDNVEFSHCEVTGLHSDCVIVRGMFKIGVTT